MKKKLALIITFLFIIPIIIAVLCSYTHFKSHFSLEIVHESKVVLKKDYQIPIKTIIDVTLKYNGDYTKFLKARESQSNKEKLNSLSPYLYEDVINFQQYNIKSEDAGFKWNEDTTSFTYFKEKSGLEIDEDRLVDDIFASIGANKPLPLPTKTISPTKKTIDSKKATMLRGYFSTNYASSTAPRKHNIALAASRLNGKTIAPHSELSFNKIVGERTIQNGFMESIIISDGNFVPGTGGGVCQVSTTFYNACLRAGLKFKSIKPHSLPISYVDPSFDAMVSSKNDLVVINSSDYAFYIKTRTNGNEIEIFVYGANLEDGYEFSIRSQIDRIIDCTEYTEVIDEKDFTLKPGESKILRHPQPGLVSSAYKDYYKDGVLVKSERIRQDHYSPQKGIIAIKPLDEILDQ